MSVFDIAALEHQREGIEERLHKLREDLALTQGAIDRAQADYFRLEGMISLLTKGFPELADRKKRNPPPPQMERVQNPPRLEVAELAIAIIKEAGEPLRRADLFEAAKQRGMVIGGKDPMMVFSTMLWRERDRIVRFRDFGYWPADEPYPPAGYYPDQQTELFR